MEWSWGEVSATRMNWLHGRLKEGDLRRWNCRRLRILTCRTYVAKKYPGYLRIFEANLVFLVGSFFFGGGGGGVVNRIGAIEPSSQCPTPKISKKTTSKSSSNPNSAEKMKSELDWQCGAAKSLNLVWSQNRYPKFDPQPCSVSCCSSSNLVFWSITLESLNLSA